MKLLYLHIAINAEITIVAASRLQCQHLWSFLKEAKKIDLMPFFKQTILFNMPRDSRALPGVKLKAVSTLALFFPLLFPKTVAKSREEKIS